jgi:hypothetical protein
MVRDMAQPAAPTAKISIPMYNGVFRPILSLIGPQMSWANVNPMRKPVMVSSALPFNSFAIEGIAGR